MLRARPVADCRSHLQNNNRLDSLPEKNRASKVHSASKEALETPSAPSSMERNRSSSSSYERKPPEGITMNEGEPKKRKPGSAPPLTAVFFCVYKS